MFGNFFLFCAGTDPKLVEKCPAPERAKQVTIGMIVLLTACSAVLSSAFALRRVFPDGSTYIVIPVAIMFGLFVLGIDRLMLLTWKPKGEWLDLLRAAPRLIMAALVALVIAKPLELKLVENRIARTLEDRRQAALLKDISHHNDATGLNAATGRVEREQQELKALAAKEGADPPGDLFKAAVRNNDRCVTELVPVQQRLQRGWPQIERRMAQLASMLEQLPSGQENPELLAAYRGEQAQASALRSAVDQKRAECQRLAAIVTNQRRDYAMNIAEERQRHTEALAREEKERTDAGTRAQQEIARDVTINDSAFGANLISELEALGDLSAASATMWWINMMITLLFVSIDIAPVLMKFMAGTGPYDRLVEAEEIMATAKHAALGTFYTEKNRFGEVMEEEHRAWIVERSTAEQVDAAVRFGRHVENAGKEFEEIVRNVLRSTARASGSAEEAEAYVTRLRNMFTSIRQTALSKFLAETRKNMGARHPGKAHSTIFEDDSRQPGDSSSLH